MDILHAKLNVICNGCGKLMRDMGEWPTQYPRGDDQPVRVLQSRRFMCQTCRVPSDAYERGYPVGFAIVDDGEGLR